MFGDGSKLWYFKLNYADSAKCSFVFVFVFVDELKECVKGAQTG